MSVALTERSAGFFIHDACQERLSRKGILDVNFKEAVSFARHVEQLIRITAF